MIIMIIISFYKIFLFFRSYILYIPTLLIIASTPFVLVCVWTNEVD